MVFVIANSECKHNGETKVGMLIPLGGTGFWRPQNEMTRYL